MSPLDDLLERFRRRDRRALSRLLTLASRDEFAEPIRRALGRSARVSEPAAMPGRRSPEVPGDLRSGGWSGQETGPQLSGRVVAFTGSGGVGKSSLIGRLIDLLRDRGRTVAVLACDPESPLTGGALLGDRVRISRRTDDPGLFVRSLAAVGGHQALADHLDLMGDILLAWGFDVILLETVGAGQGDTAVRDLADVLVVLVQPEGGDDIQWEKAGLLEVADVVVVNKADLPRAETVAAQVQRELNLPGCRPVPVVRTSAAKNDGLDELWSVIESLPLRDRTQPAAQQRLSPPLNKGGPGGVKQQPTTSATPLTPPGPPLVRGGEKTGSRGGEKKGFPTGKLPADVLGGLLERYAPGDPRVLVGPGVGVDAAVIEMGDRCLVAKTDPVTFAAEEIGWYAVHVNANDIACCGAVPRWFLATLLLPERGTTAELVEGIFEQMSRACRQLGVSLCGGHTEITAGLERPIVVGQMLGEVPRDGIITARGAQAGDVLIVTKGIAVEGTALIAREKRNELRGVLTDEELQQSADLLHTPGISIVPEARLAQEVGGVHALHDPTEGGLATGLRELAQASGVGLEIDEAALPLLPECERLCRHFGLDPLGLIASGSLLIAADPARADAILARLHQDGIAAAAIGEIVPAERGVMLRAADGSLRPLPVFPRDEIARLFA